MSVALTALCVMVAAAGPASAHTELVSVTPGPGKRVVVAAPLAVSLTFTEAIDPALANVAVVDESENVVETGPVTVNGATATMVTRDVPAPGEYVVRYRVVSADGHPVDGESTFRVAAPKSAPGDPAATPSPDATAQAGPEAAPDAEVTETPSASEQTAPAAISGDDGGSGVGLVIGVVAAAAALGVLAAVARRRGARAGSGGA